MSKAYGSGMSRPAPPIYRDNTKVDLIAPVSNLENRDYPSWVRWSGVNNLVIPTNFILKGWFYPAKTSMKLLKLSSTLATDYIDVYYQRGASEDYLVVQTRNGTKISKSFGEVLNSKDKCFIWMKHNNGTWDVRLEVLESSPDTVINWNDTSDAEYNTTTDVAYEDETYGSYVATPDSFVNIGNTFNSLIISNGVFDHLTITENLNEPYDNVPTDVNNIYTLFNCNFNDNIICLLLNAPVLITPISSFDAQKDSLIRFTTDEEGIVKNRLQVFDAETDQLVYEDVQIRYDFYHVIPANTLVNGKKYYARLKDYTRSDAESYWSNIAEFWCYSDPRLTCNIKDGDTLKNSTASFRVKYEQDEGEKAKWLEINLYDSNGTLVARSNKLTNTNNPPVTFAFDAMAHSEGIYYADITLETVTGRQVHLDITFIVDISEEKEQYLNVEDNCTGYIDVSAYPNVMGLGTSKPEPPIYLEHEKVKCVSCVSDLDDVVNCNWVRWSNVGLNIPSNFVLSCWFSPSRTANKLMKMYSVTQNDYVEIWYRHGVNTDYIEVTTGGGALITADFGQIVTINDPCFLWLKHDNGVWTLRCEKLSTGIPILISWNNGSNAELNVSTDIPYLDEDHGGYIPPTNIALPLGNDIDSVIIANGIFDHININSNVNAPYSTIIPTQSTSTTVMNAAFKDSLSCSDISADKVIIYHTEDDIDPEAPDYDPTTTNWVKLFEKPLTAGFNDIYFGDLIVKSNSKLWYMAEYYSDDTLIQAVYKSITPHFNRVFISDPTKTFKFEANVIYSNNTQNIQVGQLLPLGSKYPILIQNSMTNYKSGNISFTVLGGDFEKDGKLDREKIRAQGEEILAFLTNRKAKIIKDYNGNLFVFKVVGTPTITYNSSWGNGIMSIGFDWVEQADYHDLDALRELGFYTIQS